MAPLKRLIPSNSNVLLELKRIADVLGKTPHDSKQRLPLPHQL